MRWFGRFRVLTLVSVASLGIGLLADPAAGWHESSADDSTEYVTLATGDRVCVPSVRSQFDALRVHAEASGFFVGRTPDPSVDRHYQGIQRLTEPGNPYFFISRNNNPVEFGGVEFGGDAGPGSLVVVELGSKVSEGERIRSTKLVTGKYTSNTPPPASDLARYSIEFDGSGWPAYAHVGGMQLVDGVLAVALEHRLDSPSQAPGMVVLIDVSSPLRPTMIQEVPLGWIPGAGAVALARHPDRDTYVMIVARDNLYVYESDNRDLSSSTVWSYKGSWVGSELIGGDWPTGPGGHQSINLIEQCDGDLFLIGTRNTLPTGVGGVDWADLYQIAFTTSGEIALREISSKHMVCNAEAGRNCDFAAAAAPYVSPTGELILYATEHHNDGPNDSVRMGEFRHEDMYRPGSPLRLPAADAGGPYDVVEGSEFDLHGLATPPQAKPWIELFERPNFGGYSFVVDWDDRYKEDLDDLDEIEADLTSWADLFDPLGGFGDETSSVRWEAPPLCGFELFADQDYEGDWRDFDGSGSVDQWEDLSSGAFNNEAHSVGSWGIRCDEWAMRDHAWDLDDDGIYETAGATASFSAASIDGPGSVEIHFQARDAWNRYVTDTALVRIHNTAPSVEFTYFDSILEGRFGLFELRFWDAGKDPVTVTIDWGDGTQDRYRGSPPYPIVTARHEYADDEPSGTPTDPVTIRIYASDDDHATSETQHMIEVRNANPLVTIESLQDPGGDEVETGVHSTVHGERLTLDATYRDAGESDTHTASVDWGDGTIDRLGTVDGSVHADHAYTRRGRFTVTVSVTDDDTGVGAATRTVDVANSAPVALDDLERVARDESVIIDCLANDTDIDGDTLAKPTIRSDPKHGRVAVLPDGSVKYTHDGGGAATDTFTYTTSDGTKASNTATVSINITTGEPNRAPTALPDAATVGPTGIVDIDVLGNDSDPDGDTLAVLLERPPDHGSVTLKPGGIVRYIYDGSPTSTDSFTYRATDGALTSAPVAVTIGIVGSFVDDDDSVFEADIEWMAAEGITKGCNPPVNDRFCPDGVVTRGQMAAFLARALGLTERLDDPFIDDDDSVFEADIEKLAAAGITRGCNPPTNDRFCPDGKVTREVMAAFLVRALGYTDNGGGDLFTDDDDSIFEGDIDRLGTAGVTKGCNPPTNDRYCPKGNVTRGQMAAFLHRALG